MSPPVATESAIDLVGQPPLESADGFLLGIAIAKKALEVGRGYYGDLIR